MGFEDHSTISKTQSKTLENGQTSGAVYSISFEYEAVQFEDHFQSNSTRFAINQNLRISFSSFRLTHDFSNLWEVLLVMFLSYIIFGMCCDLLLIEMKLVKILTLFAFPFNEHSKQINRRNSFRVRMQTSIQWRWQLYSCSHLPQSSLCLAFASLGRECTGHSMKSIFRLSCSNGIYCHGKRAKSCRPFSFFPRSQLDFRFSEVFRAIGKHSKRLVECTM